MQHHVLEEQAILCSDVRREGSRVWRDKLLFRRTPAYYGCALQEPNEQSTNTQAIPAAVDGANDECPDSKSFSTAYSSAKSFTDYELPYFCTITKPNDPIAHIQTYLLADRRAFCFTQWGAIS